MKKQVNSQLAADDGSVFGGGLAHAKKQSKPDGGHSHPAKDQSFLMRTLQQDIVVVLYYNTKYIGRSFRKRRWTCIYCSKAPNAVGEPKNNPTVITSAVCLTSVIGIFLSHSATAYACTCGYTEQYSTMEAAYGSDLKPRFKSNLCTVVPVTTVTKLVFVIMFWRASLSPPISIPQLLLLSLEFCIPLLFRISQPLLALLQFQVPHLKLYIC